MEDSLLPEFDMLEFGLSPFSEWIQYAATREPWPSKNISSKLAKIIVVSLYVNQIKLDIRFINYALFLVPRKIFSDKQHLQFKSSDSDVDVLAGFENGDTILKSVSFSVFAQDHPWIDDDFLCYDNLGMFKMYQNEEQMKKELLSPFRSTKSKKKAVNLEYSENVEVHPDFDWKFIQNIPEFIRLQKEKMPILDSDQRTKLQNMEFKSAIPKDRLWDMAKLDNPPSTPLLPPSLPSSLLPHPPPTPPTLLPHPPPTSPFHLSHPSQLSHPPPSPSHPYPANTTSFSVPNPYSTLLPFSINPTTSASPLPPYSSTPSFPSSLPHPSSSLPHPSSSLPHPSSSLPHPSSYGFMNLLYPNQANNNFPSHPLYFASDGSSHPLPPSFSSLSFSSPSSSSPSSPSPVTPSHPSTTKQSHIGNFTQLLDISTAFPLLPTSVDLHASSSIPSEYPSSPSPSSLSSLPPPPSPSPYAPSTSYASPSHPNHPTTTFSNPDPSTFTLSASTLSPSTPSPSLPSFSPCTPSASPSTFSSSLSSSNLSPSAFSASASPPTPQSTPQLSTETVYSVTNGGTYTFAVHTPPVENETTQSEPTQKKMKPESAGIMLFRISVKPSQKWPYYSAAIEHFIV